MLSRMNRSVAALCLAAAMCIPASASEFHGQVLYAGLPVPGATVTATQADKKLTAVTDSQGVYSFPDLPDGAWHIEVAMTLFTSQSQDLTIGPNMPMLRWDLKLLPQDQVLAKATVQKPEAPPAPAVVASTGGISKKF